MKRATASFSREPVVFESLPKPFYCQVTNTLTGMERRDAAFASLKKKEGRRRRRRRRRRRWRRRMKFPGGFFFLFLQRVNSNRHQLDSRCWYLMELYWLRYADAGSDFYIDRISTGREREKSSKSSSVMSNINTVGFYCVRVCVCV